MAVSLDVRADVHEVTRYLRGIERKAIPKATVTAINRTLKTVRAEAARSITKETSLPVGKVKKKIRLYRASRSLAIGTLDATQAKAENLIEFVRPGQQTPTAFRKRLKSGQFRRAGVQAKAWGKRKTYRGTFIGRSGKGELKVWKRTGASRGKITLVAGPSIRRTFVRAHILKAMGRKATTRFRIEFRRALEHNLRVGVKEFAG